jgi:glycyl-tRNA synthetase (class II)
MAFIVKKTIHGQQYYYLKESRRLGDKVVSRTIAYFGKKRPLKKEVEAKLKLIKARPEERSLSQKNYVPKDKPFKPLGFVYPNSEIYGGVAGFFDYGHLGVELKNNIKKAFWKIFVQQREDVVGIDGAIITHPKVWKASGHVDSFTDYIYKCDKCKSVAKGDDDKGLKCPKCGADMGDQGQFNLMFTTQVGLSKDNISYLRPETAQIIFTNYRLVQESATTFWYCTNRKSI